MENFSLSRKSSIKLVSLIRRKQQRITFIFQDV